MGFKIRQNNQWKDMTQGIQWRLNNEWNRQTPANYPNYYVLKPIDWESVGANVLQYLGYDTDHYIVIPETDGTGTYPTYEVVIPGDVPLHGVTTGSAELKSTEYLFYGKYGQNAIELDYFFTPEVESMENMFAISEYEHLDLRSFDTKKCTRFGSMFMATQNLITLDISSFDIEEYYDDVSYMFDYSSVETVYVKNEQTAYYLDMEGGKSGINFIVGSST